MVRLHSAFMRYLSRLHDPRLSFSPFFLFTPKIIQVLAHTQYSFPKFQNFLYTSHTHCILHTALHTQHYTVLQLFKLAFYTSQTLRASLRTPHTHIKCTANVRKAHHILPHITDIVFQHSIIISTWAVSYYITPALRYPAHCFFLKSFGVPTSVLLLLLCPHHGNFIYRFLQFLHTSWLLCLRSLCFRFLHAPQTSPTSVGPLSRRSCQPKVQVEGSAADASYLPYLPKVPTCLHLSFNSRTYLYNDSLTIIVFDFSSMIISPFRSLAGAALGSLH
jgi:hypothetical protein